MASHWWAGSLGEGLGSDGQHRQIAALQSKSLSASGRQPQLEGSRRAFCDISNTTTSQNSGKESNVQSQQHLKAVRSLGTASDNAATTSRRVSQEVTDIDALNRDHPCACAQYAQAIMTYIKEDAQLRNRPDPFYLDRVQPDMNSNMRAILIEWLVEVADEYTLLSDTLFQSVNYLDRYLSKVPVHRSKLQLVGIACMWIASKYEEEYSPSARQFCEITENTYTVKQLLEMEREVLRQLNYECTVPTTKIFLRRCLQVCDAGEDLHYTASYIAELSLLDHHMLRFLPSMIAAAAVLITRKLLHLSEWSPTLAYYSGYHPADLYPCAKALLAFLERVSSNSLYPATYNKYSRECYGRVACEMPSRLAFLL